MKRSLVTMVILLISTTAQAAAPWILVLPPTKTAPAPAQDTPSNDPVRAVTDALDRQAPITDWQRGETFDGAEACEDARLAHGRQFRDAREALGSREPSESQRQRLAALAREAFGRCVPAFAFSENQPR